MADLDPDLAYSLFGTDPPSPNMCVDEVSDAGNGFENEMVDEEISQTDEVSDSRNSIEKSMEEEEIAHGDLATFDEIEAHGPRVGMEFPSMEAILAAYQRFGKSHGFCVAIRNSREDKYCMICCDRGRKADEVKKHTKRLNCPARISAIKDSNGRWRLSKVSAAHNHPLDPNMSNFMPGHRFMTTSMKRQLEAFDIAGLQSCRNVRVLEVQQGGPQNLSCTTKDCRNFIDERRRLRLGEVDADAMKKLFTRLQQKDKSFFHLMEIDDHGRLLNVMWIHPRSRAAYEDFHDVVSFDTTYLVNRYQMPFATVVGINHHNQSILLGCALLKHEHAQSFKWFFSNWLQAMGGIYPTAILTDQCESIKIAIREVMPHTVHRFCLWHILCKVPQKFKGITPYTDATDEFTAMIYNCMSTDEFEDKWDKFVTQYGAQNNRWLKDLYAERYNWVPVYLKNVFWAGMRSMQRSESMHAFFDGYITSTSTLKMFVEQYEIAITDKVKREMEQDYKSKCVFKRRMTNFGWEDQLGNLYTHNIMDLVQDEIKKLMRCNASLVEDPNDNTTGIERYEVLELGIIGNRFHKQFKFIIEYRPQGDYFDCECRMFQSKGILCCHIFKIIVMKDICLVNDRYILRRWRKDVYRPHSSIIFAGAYPHMTEEYKMYQDVERVFQECTDLALNCPQKMKLIKKRCLEMMDELYNMPHDDIRDHGSEEYDVPLLNPNVVRGVGRPKGTRMKNPIERTTPRSQNNNVEGTESHGTVGRQTNSRGRRPTINLNRAPRRMPANRVNNAGSILRTQNSAI